MRKWPLPRPRTNSRSDGRDLDLERPSNSGVTKSSLVTDQVMYLGIGFFGGALIGLLTVLHDRSRAACSHTEAARKH